MLAINSIKSFFSLTLKQQYEILEGLKTKERLNEFLERRNTETRSFERQCIHCNGTGIEKIKYRRDTDTDFHASSIGYCLRKTYYDVSGYKEFAISKNDAQSFRTLDAGNSLHDLLQEYGRQGAYCAPEFYQAEVPIEPNLKIAEEKGFHILPLAEKYKVRSHVDAILWSVEVPVSDIGIVSVRVGHEYKNVGSKSFNFLKGPKETHIKQATIYNVIFDIPIMVYVYMNTDNYEIKDYPTIVNLDIWEEAIKKETFDEIEYYKSINEPPPFEKSAAMLNPIECTGKDRFTGCKYYGTVCNPPLNQIKRK